MTSLEVPVEELPLPNGFLSSVCPGIDSVSDNTHFSLEPHLNKYPASIKAINWPLTSSSTGVSAVLDARYLNVARPPLNPGPGLYESSTYVSLPYHVHNLFHQVIVNRTQQKTQDGGVQIGANFSGLVPDPFGLVHLNPGCLTQVIDVESKRGNVNSPAGIKNPLIKLTNNFNKLLNINMGSSPDTADSKSLANAFKPDSVHFEKLLDYDQDVYSKTLSNPDLSKLMVSVNVNVVNVMAIDTGSQYMGTSTIKTKKPLSSLLVEPSQGDQPSDKKPTREYERVIETPLLRFSLKNSCVVTSLRAFTSGGRPRAILGLNSGELIVLNLYDCTYVVLPNVVTSFRITDSHPFGSIMSPSVTWNPVTSLEVIDHPAYEYVVVAGYSNGEVTVINPSAYSESAPKYTKKEVDKDHFVTYFRKFDLSAYKDTEGESSQWLLGHLKLSNKPITAVASTVDSASKYSGIYNPLLLAVGADDGLVRVISLNSTYGKDYGSKDRPVCKSIVSDVICNYFQDGVTDIKFSADYKFLCVVGKGDLIELFRISYYNVTALLNSNSGSQNPGRRSRSGTVNSTNSGAASGPVSSFSLLSPQLSSPSNSFDVSPRTDETEPRTSHSPMIKDIKIASRLKGHTNTVLKVEFVKPEQYTRSELEHSTSVYRLISCGLDGKVVIWEFDSKVIPKIKKTKPVKKKQSQPQTPQPNASKVFNNGPSSSRMHRHARTKSNYEDQNGFLPSGLPNTLSVNNMTAVLSQSNSNVNLRESGGESSRGVIALYNSLHDVRVRKHYTNLLLDKNHEVDYSKIKKYCSIIHPIEHDKTVPSIEIPLATLDLVTWFKDGKIDGFYLDGLNFWCFGKNGDIIRYTID